MTDLTRLRFYQRPAFYAGMAMLIAYLTLNFAYMSRGAFNFGYSGVAILELVNGPENKFANFVRIENAEILYITVLFPLLAVGLLLTPVTTNRSLTKAISISSLVLSVFVAFFIEFALFDIRSRGSESDFFMSNSGVSDAFSAGAGLGIFVTMFAALVASVEGSLVNVLGIRSMAVDQQSYYNEQGSDIAEDMRPYGVDEENEGDQENFFGDSVLPEGEKIDFEDKTEPKRRKKDDFWES